MRSSDVEVVSASGSSPAGAIGSGTSRANSTAPGQRRADVVIGLKALGAAEEAADFQSIRPRLFGIAYQMLGRAADAEDVVQDVWVRWHGADRAQVRDRTAFLVTITTRTALNVVTSARARREVPVDRWLPEQVPACHDPTLAAERSADLEAAIRLLLERLSPIERAVFVLREAFEYPFRDIADALEISESNTRQLGRRARSHLTEQRHQRARPAEADQLFTAFLDAARAGTWPACSTCSSMTSSPTPIVMCAPVILLSWRQGAARRPVGVRGRPLTSDAGVVTARRGRSCSRTHKSRPM